MHLMRHLASSSVNKVVIMTSSNLCCGTHPAPATCRTRPNVITPKMLKLMLRLRPPAHGVFDQRCITYVRVAHCVAS
jgi:hypothetical protein